MYLVYSTNKLIGLDVPIVSGQTIIPFSVFTCIPILLLSASCGTRGVAAVQARQMIAWRHLKADTKSMKMPNSKVQNSPRTSDE